MVTSVTVTRADTPLADKNICATLEFQANGCLAKFCTAVVGRGPNRGDCLPGRAGRRCSAALRFPSALHWIRNRWRLLAAIGCPAELAADGYRRSRLCHDRLLC